MMLSFATKSLVLGLIAGIAPAANAQTCSIVIPEMTEVMEIAFPTWNVDANNNRIEGGGKWNPYYLTKRWNGLDPKLGGYPTPIDTRYPFEFAAPFNGQPGAGSPHHCPKGTTNDTPVQSCPKLITDNDDGEYGIGHVPPPIALAVVRNAVKDCVDESEFESWFDFESTTAPCDILPSVLATMIRNKYPRDPKTGAVKYPPPVIEGTFEYYELEFPSPQGPPHWCTDDFLASGQWVDYCPYVFEGPNAGKYRHPHLALSAVMQYIAHSINPDVCGVEWDARGYPKVPDTSIAWATMDSEEMGAQPVLPYNWPENGDNKKKDVPGLVSMVSVGDFKPTPLDPPKGPEPPKMGEPVDDMTETAPPTEDEASGSSSVSVFSAIASVVLGCVFF
uniref:Uncharacterized protein n=1 Tax=Pseudo-nitzschia australis TaxID=44445 RepID=A0A7S4EMS4_9STRA|mmetsp:Transcript_24698/g.54181  ORF Transcript_24698/g.54181 Transcript_24698/m.54181 type:complete len:390 (+) Transcript_24698:181-1350(+)|eukprot:CAMPEP_0168200666 /NCGR_PEP_ID=MMETSP0139_2-20121125/23224_1 /TAXON_ID=44445 /ORGANISM="Pseudo-nitzschia australis, Strain 10249 10 AB" /LENGTH=389 /DNA_ID=CAMNT_0008126029 /DNA_START=124 /DNA_END=1293 /DNA_ORIENTATION=+